MSYLRDATRAAVEDRDRGLLPQLHELAAVGGVSYGHTQRLMAALHAQGHVRAIKIGSRKRWFTTEFKPKEA